MRPLSASPLAPTTLAVVDLGSNSFRLELGEVHGHQIRVLETLREMLRFGGGLDKKNRVTASARRRALMCLARFGERLRDFDPSHVRAVATNTFRIAANIDDFLPEAEMTLGFPIEVISGHEEARLIYLGTSYCLPRVLTPRLIMDIGGGSTEFIIGHGRQPQKLESLKLGCVNMSKRFFAKGRLSAANFKKAETYARAEIEPIARAFDRKYWREAFASSGSAQALAEILEANGFSLDGITPDGLTALRKKMIAGKTLSGLKLAALKPERAPVLAGGLVIMRAAMTELRIPRIAPVGGAMRLGVLYELLGRHHDHDSRDTTVELLLDDYQLDRPHVRRIAALALELFRQLHPKADAADAQMLQWAALLYGVGASISHIGYHRHSAYILLHRDMPGFSSAEQKRLAVLALTCRGSLGKAMPYLQETTSRMQILALRLALLFYRARRPIDLPAIQLRMRGKTLHYHLSARWLAAHPLTEYLIDKERREWEAAGWKWKEKR
ncbi:MAG: Ppx/GppA family phosphatase [Burkholderiales bacterium]|jgi:exopolyphosphatase/guanosine-5'-triphosphate,3'-diphosphate pyrophosphatase|nr:Ppx/GppA family phosphatase [Burkholderiales bacterium]